MKAKKLFSLLLAALMATSSMSVAFADTTGWEVDFADSGRLNYYKLDEDDGRIKHIDSFEVPEFAPGDTIYILLETEPGTSSKDIKGADVYTDWEVNKDWVESVEIVYKKGDVYVVTPPSASSGTRTKTYSFSGPVSALNGEYTLNYTAGQTAADMRAALLTQLTSADNLKKVENAIYASYPKADKWLAQGVGYFDSREVAQAEAIKKGLVTVNEGGTGTVYKIPNTTLSASTEGELRKLVEANLTTCGYTAAGAAAYVKKSDSTLVATGTAVLQDKKFTKVGSTTTVYLPTGASDDVKTQAGMYKMNADGDYTVEWSIDPAAANVWLENTTGTDAYRFVANDYVDTWIQGNMEDGAYFSDYRKANPANDFVKTGDTTNKVVSKDDAVNAVMATKTTETVTTKTTYTYKAENGQTVTSETFPTSIVPNSTVKVCQVDGNWVDEGTASNKANAAAKPAIEAEVNKLTDLSQFGDLKVTNARTPVGTVSSGYHYFIAIETEESATTKDIDLYGEIGVGRTRTIAKDNTKSFDITLTNGDGSNDKESGDVYIEPNTPAVVRFDDDAREIVIEFADDAYWEGDFRDQKLNLAYNNEHNKTFANRYDHANLDFYNFPGNPVSNRTNTMYIYADEDTYLYEVTKKGAKKVNGAYYDEDEGAWVFRTRELTSYVISDKKLKTVDQLDDTSSSKPDSSKPDSGNKPTYPGKPNPDTGR